MNMATFIARMIMAKAEVGIEQGKEKYRAYFIKTKLYEKWREDVETILLTEGCEECIVAE